MFSVFSAYFVVMFCFLPLQSKLHVVRDHSGLVRHQVPNSVGTWHVLTRCLPHKWAGGWMSTLICYLLPAFFCASTLTSLSVFCLSWFLGAFSSPEMPQPVVGTKANWIHLLHSHSDPTASTKFSLHSDGTELMSLSLILAFLLYIV